MQFKGKGILTCLNPVKIGFYDSCYTNDVNLEIRIKKDELTSIEDLSKIFDLQKIVDIVISVKEENKK